MSNPVKSIQWGQEKISQIEIYPTLSSTNSFAKERISAGAASGTVIWALQQTAGRGRRGRSWESDHASLTFSVLWQCPTDFSLGILPLTAGLGLAQHLGALIPELKVKWPNDLWVGQRKLVGILGESILHRGSRWVILGVGLNVNNSSVVADEQRISLQEVTACSWPRLGILDLALVGIEQGFSLAQGQGEDLSTLFRRHGNFLDRTITVWQGQRSWVAMAKEVLLDGRLLIEDAQGVHALLPDEISVRF